MAVTVAFFLGQRRLLARGRRRTDLGRRTGYGPQTKADGAVVVKNQAGVVVVVAVKRGSAVETKAHQSTHNRGLTDRVRRAKSAQAC